LTNSARQKALHLTTLTGSGIIAALIQPGLKNNPAVQQHKGGVAAV